MSSPEDPNFSDPFLEEDPEATERARRRAEREARRRSRDNRQSLASRVSGVLDDAAHIGREKIEQTRERARSPEPPTEGVEPPSFRRPPAAPLAKDIGESPVQPEQPSAATPPAATPSAAAPTGEEPTTVRRPEPTPATAPEPESAEHAVEPDTILRRPGDRPPEQRLSAEAAMPRRESTFTPRPIDTAEGDAIAPEPITVPPDRPAAGESEEWSAPPPPLTPAGGGAGGGAGGPSGRRPRRAATATGWKLWRRRLLALGAIVVLVVGAAFAVKKVGGSDPAPVGKPEPALKTVDVTIPEGLTTDQIAEVAKKAGLKGDYKDAVKQAQKKFDVQKLGGPKDATLEGFLFPATYEVEKGAPVSDLVEKQLTEGFENNFAQVDMSKAKKANLTEFDVVTIASMIEREVQVPKERPIVASVIYNRLKQGIPLEIDATVRYAIGNDYTKALEPSDLQVDSCYNTYLNPGLPCGPISNPGLDSLKAAANPSDDKYLYYVVKPGTCPAAHSFFEDYDDFVNASAEYDAAQAEAGGKPNC